MCILKRGIRCAEMPKDIRDFFIQNVRIALAKRGMSASDLARKMGLKPQQINEYLGGKTAPGLEKLAEFAAALEVPIEHLIRTDRPVEDPFRAMVRELVAETLQAGDEARQAPRAALRALNGGTRGAIDRVLDECDEESLRVVLEMARGTLKYQKEFAARLETAEKKPPAHGNDG